MSNKLFLKKTGFNSLPADVYLTSDSEDKFYGVSEKGKIFGYIGDQLDFSGEYEELTSSKDYEIEESSIILVFNRNEAFLDSVRESLKESSILTVSCEFFSKEKFAFLVSVDYYDYEDDLTNAHDIIFEQLAEFVEVKPDILFYNFGSYEPRPLNENYYKNANNSDGTTIFSNIVMEKSGYVVEVKNYHVGGDYSYLGSYVTYEEDMENYPSSDYCAFLKAVKGRSEAEGCSFSASGKVTVVQAIHYI